MNMFVHSFLKVLTVYFLLKVFSKLKLIIYLLKNQINLVRFRYFKISNEFVNKQKRSQEILSIMLL